MTHTAARNPFRMRRVEALGYLPQGATWDELLARCDAFGCRGAIVGPHGSGKTTLICDLARRLRDRGEHVTALFTNSDGNGRLPDTWRSADRDAVVLADGYDTLDLLARRWLRRHARRLIVTTHRPCRLPTLVRTEAQPAVLSKLVERLSGEAMSLSDAAHRLREHGGNMRDVLRALYDEAGSAR